MTTIISMYFDLQRRDPKRGSTRQTRDYYLQRSRFVLSINQPMVIFCDPEFVEYFTNERQKLCPTAPFQIVSIPLESTAYYHLKEKFGAFRKEHPTLGFSDDKDTDFYTVMIHLKFYFFLDIVRKNPFNTRYFSYIDLGIGGLFDSKSSIYPSMISDVFCHPSDKIRVTEMRPILPSDHINDVIMFYGCIRAILVSDFFIGERTIADKVANLVIQEFKDCISAHIFPNDEQVFNRIYGLHPDLFNVTYGDYQYCFQNYYFLREGVDLILSNLEKCRLLDLRDKGVRLISEIDRSIRYGHLCLNETQRLKFWTECYLIYYYVDQSKARDTFHKICIRAGTSSEFRHVVIEHRDLLSGYFSFLEEKQGRRIGVVHQISMDEIKKLSKDNTVHIMGDFNKTTLFLKIDQPRFVEHRFDYDIFL